MGDKWELIGKIKISTWKLKVLESLDKNTKIPSELSKETEISSSHISEVLSELVKMNLIECKNPKLRKGKMYAITKLGREILKEAVK